jgi:glycerophosphoryl diester phosphodiesterase
MNWISQNPIAHRGLHKGFNIPENSFASFERAINKKYTIELDVRITKDKKVMAFHDKNLIRMCRIKKKIASSTLKNLSDIRLYKTKESIPVFSELLEFVNAKVPLLIEIKNYGVVGEFEEAVVKDLENYKGEFAICSFNPNVLKWFQENEPNILRGMVFGDLKKFEIKYYKTVFLYRLIKYKPHFVSLDSKLLDTVLVEFTRWFKKPLLSWTIDTKKKLKKARNRKVDNIIFELIKPSMKVK